MGLNQVDFAVKIGLKSATGISGYENNTREPDISTLIKIAELGEKSLDWLLTGKELEKPQETFLTEQEQRLLKIFRKLSPNDRDLIVGKALERKEQEQQRGLGKKAPGAQEESAA